MDCQNHVNSGSQLNGLSVGDLWEASIKLWSILYTGYLRKLYIDQGNVFTSICWLQHCNTLCTKLQLSEVESHHLLGLRERYHAPPIQVYLKERHELPYVDKETSLLLTINELNDTMELEGLVPPCLVSRVLPRFPAVNTLLPDRFICM